MKTRLSKDARLLALLAVLAVLPLAIWACSDAGDSPAGPTGPGTVYNQNITDIRIIAGHQDITQGATSTYRAQVTANCAYKIQFTFEYGVWKDDVDLDGEVHTWNNVGEFSVFARAKCAAAADSTYELSDPLLVTVKAAP